MFPLARRETKINLENSFFKFFLFGKKNGRIKSDAKANLTNAKLKGGISNKPIFVTGGVPAPISVIRRIAINAICLSLITNTKNYREKEKCRRIPSEPLCRKKYPKRKKRNR